MTIEQAIREADELEPNTVDESDKIRWLSKLDADLWRSVVSTHEGGAETMPQYDEETDTETELIAEAPYDEMYVHWLQANILYKMQETGRYNNAIALHNAEKAAYRLWYNRTHMPVQVQTRYY